MTNYDESRAVLRRRLEIESELLRDLRLECVRVIMAIAELGYSEAMDGMSFRLSLCSSIDEITSLLKELREWIYINVTHGSQLAIDEVERHWPPAVPLSAGDIVNRDIGGKTLKERIGIYGNRLRTETEMWIAAGLLAGVTLSQLEKEVRAFLSSPYSSRLFLDALGKNAASRRLRDGVPHFGSGSVTSAVGSLERLGTSTIADSLRMAQWLSWGSDENVIGYQVYRGSSYPCSLCDSMTGFHVKGFEELPPYHSRCCCFAVPVMR